MSPLRRLLTITSRVGRPGTLVSLGCSEGNLLYLELAMPPVSITAALEAADVAALHAAAGEWLRERAEIVTGVPALPAAGTPLVAGLLGRLTADAARSRTVQSRTVHSADQQEHLPTGV